MTSEPLERPDGDVQYGLVMPFVVCNSKGGPYDDQSFVAGVHFGQIKEQAARIYREGGEREWWVYPALVPQFDLLAMDMGLTIETQPWSEDPEAWTLLRLRRAGLTAGEVDDEHSR